MALQAPLGEAPRTVGKRLARPNQKRKRRREEEGGRRKGWNRGGCRPRGLPDGCSVLVAMLVVV
eukprot:8633845-Pyramimonas_sp.AAC.1